MALSSVSSARNPSSISTILPNLRTHWSPSLSFTSSISISSPKTHGSSICLAAAKQKSGSTKKNSSTDTNKRKKKKADDRGGFSRRRSVDEGIEDEGDVFVDELDEIDVLGSGARSQPLPLPKPPAGFVVDEDGKVLMASNKRIVTLIDPNNNLPLECSIRRMFRSSRDDECMLLCPVDTPIHILKSKNNEGWSDISDEEVEALLPTAAYALAKIHMHFIDSGFCYTARGGFCYTEEDIFEFHIDNGQDVNGLPTEGIEITCFHLDGSHYMIYTPSDPLLFVAKKDQSGQLQIVDDDLLEDPSVVGAIDEETEFNALVEEEAALLETLSGKR